MTSPILFKLLLAHFLCDFPLQGDYMAKFKSWKQSGSEPDVAGWLLLGHGTIHGGAVYLVTGSQVLGVIETVLHVVIDSLKITGKITYSQDQWAHLGCKFAYVALIHAGLG